MNPTIERKWWKEEVIYQIYPRSFKDSTGNGVGDLRGIISKLDHLKNLGIDIIWLSPIYESPNDDNGYDISDYQSVDPEYGTMADFDELLEKVHAKGMKLIMDLVVNHSSDEHRWFEESRKSKDNPYRDYYFWKKGKNGGPPNNWPSFFGGSAWEYDEQTGEYYLHLFTKKQPDLNWENSKLREEIKETLRFWLDKGIDGFRMDVIPLISKRLDFSDHNYENLNDVIKNVYSNGPKVHEYINEIYRDVLSHYDILTVGEGPGISKEVGIDYVGHDRGELNMIFHLDHMFLGHGPKGKFDPVRYSWSDIKQIFRDWYHAMNHSGWVSIFLDNHDFPRLVSRFGNDQEYRERSAMMLATMVLTLRGTPCIYQGSELGMSNVAFENIEDYKDIETHSFHKEFKKEGYSTEAFLKMVHAHGRDNVRTPFHWDDSKNAGFSSGDTWIKVNPNFPEINAKKVIEDKKSIFYYYKNLLAYRKQNLTLVYGEWIEIEQKSNDLFCYDRKDDSGHFRILLNHSNCESEFNIDLEFFDLEIQNLNNPSSYKLLPWEARVYKKKK